MHLHDSAQPRVRRLALGVAALAASGLIAACGSSSSSSTTTSSSGTNTSTSRSAFVKCLKQHGATPPPGLANGGTPRAHSGAPPAGGGFAANPKLQAAFKACGATGKRPNGS